MLNRPICERKHSGLGSLKHLSECTRPFRQTLLGAPWLGPNRAFQSRQNP
jgi:hypothetical protein